MRAAKKLNEKYPQRAPVRMEIARQYLGGKCVVCDSDDRLSFDHINPAAKVLGISEAAVQMPEVHFWVEVKKCQLLCHNHHWEKTRKDRQFRRPYQKQVWA